MTVPMLQVRSPYDQQVVVEIPYDDEAALDRKLNAARAAFGRWRRRPVEERIRLVGDALGYWRTAREEVARDVTLQMGKPLEQARREVDTLLDRAEQMVALAADALAPDILPARPGFHRRIEHTPLGVVLDIAAWNYPLLIPVNVVVPALLAGNAVLLKHSAKTPRCATHFARAFGELEEGLVQEVVATHAGAAHLIADPRVDHLAFTGSVPGGHEVYRVAAERFIDAGLELGGKDPAYVAADADLGFAAENVVDGACYNAGQSCCAVERIYVHHSCYEEFLDRAREVIARYRLGDPMDAETTMGPLVSWSAADLVERQVDDALQRGAHLVEAGVRPDGPGSFCPPRLLADVPQEAEVMQEETFGPVVPVRSVADDEEAVRLMNDTRFGLTASVWTRDQERAERVAAAVDAGTIYQNRCDYLDPALPWTGVGDSGKGSTLSRYGLWHLTRRKSVHFRTET